jgi:hypothetical protein
VTREFATLDLSNASDTVSFELVKLVLPPLWFEALRALRSPSTLIEGQWCILEKFSSMGNGYTFELETLIFAALLTVMVRKLGGVGLLGVDVFVFGDDLIVPDEYASACVSMLKFFGFSLNLEKSFIGPVGFRESCGGDYFDGHDVRPHYLKKIVNEPVELVPDCNGIRRALKKLESLCGTSDLRPWHAMLDVLPSDIRQCRGPEELGDVVLHDEPHRWRFKWNHSIRSIKAIIQLPTYLRWEHWKPDVVLACAVYGTGDGTLGVTPRDSVSGYKIGWVPFS